jgi:DNA-binding beta-propeller fold protein YncE
MHLSHISRRRSISVAALACAAILVPVAARASASPAAAVGSAAPGVRPARPVTAYVSNTDSGISTTVTPISTATNKALKAITVGTYPGPIAFAPNGKTAYATSSSGVTPINTATNKPGKPIKVGNAPAAIAITPDGQTAYIANTAAGEGGAGGHTVTPVDLATNKALKAIEVGNGPRHIAITEVPRGFRTVHPLGWMSGKVK